MGQHAAEEDFIDVRKVLSLLASKWYYFVISLAVCLTVALVYLRVTPKVYRVGIKVQLRDQSLTDKGNGQQLFINGLELIAGDAQLEDEIGVLSSHTLVGKAIDRLNFGVSYYRYPTLGGSLGRLMDEEVYQYGISIVPDSSRAQMRGAPVHITFPDSGYYRVRVDAEEAYLFDLNLQQWVRQLGDYEVDTTLALGTPFVTPSLSFRLKLAEGFVPNDDYGYAVLINSREDLVDAYANKLNIAPISSESNIMEVSVLGRATKKEEAFLNALVQTYIDQDLARKNQLGVKTIEFIDSQLATVYDSLNTAEGSLETFRASSNIINVGVTSENLSQRLRELEREQGDLRVEDQYYRMTARYVQQHDDVSDVVAPSSVGISDPFLNNLLIELSKLSQEKTEKAFSSGTNNPLVKVLDQKIRNTKQSLVENLNNLIASNRIARGENQRQIEKIQAQLRALPESERDLTKIERRFALNDNIYNYLRQKRAEAGIAIASNTPDKSIVDPARANKEPVSPRTPMVVLGAFLFGLIAPLGLIFAEKLLNQKVTDSGDIQQTVGLPLMGLIPQAPKVTNLPAWRAPSSPAAEAFRFVRLGMSRLTQGEPYQVIGITSAQESEGKTFCAANLAAAYARADRSTLLIGGDLRRPQLHTYYDLKPAGLSEYLTGAQQLQALLQPTELEYLSLLNAGRTTDATQLLESRAFADFMQEVKQRFDIIIVDTPPVGLVADYQAIAPHLDITLFVVRQNQTEVSSLRGAVERLNTTERTGLILNDANGNLLREYGYGYQYSNTEKGLYV